jgi:hypothetical protein
VVLCRSDGTELLARLSVARGRREKRRGLLGRSGLDDDEGLLLKGCRMVHTFGMRFPIGLIFIDGGGRVVRIVRSLAPRRICACLRARDVVECRAGSPALETLNPGDELTVGRNE